MPDGDLFRSAFVPDYGEMLQVQKSARRYHFTAGQRYVWLLLYAAYMLVIAVAAFYSEQIANAALPFAGETLSGWVPLALIIAFAVVFYWLIGVKLSRYLSSKWLTARKAPAEMTVSADASGLTWKNNEMSSWIAWPAIERMFLTDAAVCFIYGANTLYIPRRLFRDQPECKSFVARALEHLNPQAKAASEQDAFVRKELA